ncbi:hypothetical protein [Acinetobacter sp.]|uniref:hypothetical protein n=1 Tax=Acinetobacter sp. TaxID=472 RepID=UPI003890EB27
MKTPAVVLALFAALTLSACGKKDEERTVVVEPAVVATPAPSTVEAAPATVVVPAESTDSASTTK